MTISKKLLFIIAALSINAQFNLSAYDMVGLKEEVALISEFANAEWRSIELNDRKVYLSNWLNGKIYRTYRTSNYDIITIANIIKTYNDALTSTIAENSINKLYEMEATDYRNAQFINKLMITGIVSMYCVALGYAIAKDIDLAIDHKVTSAKIETYVEMDKLYEKINALEKANKWLWQRA